MSTTAPIRGTLVAMVRAAASGELPRGWLFLEEGERTPNTSCVLLSDADAEDIEAAAKSLGFPNSTLETLDLKDIFEWTKQLVQNDPSDAELVRSFCYYVDFDTVIPSMDAPDPPPFEEARAKMDRQFYESLGQEREDVACRSAGCQRGAVALSVFCRPHHFESVLHRPCVFDD
jgi:hypothetical protein